MPGISGFDFLDRSKENPYLKLTPKIILSTSDDNQDVLKALGKGANSYIVKPRTYSELKKKINNTLSYFLYTAEQTDWEGKT
jgi:DNA-binding response OmpR family regulator